ncbi:MAG: thioesterase family protein [Pirellulaceae bacterium]|jgi:4-hydroxybenzoyl-CoA thioesterase/acyl-CoA thioester hydrolase|nr:acyl-CoA thioesterase [Planctomycetaceae bacterium]
MAELYRTTRRVEFSETDAAGMIHFSSYFLYMEQAEHELFRHLGTSVLTKDDSGTISWPRVSASCDYSRPVTFEDELQIDVGIARLGEKSVTYQFYFLKDDQQVAIGQITSVCCRLAHGQPPRPIVIPQTYVDLLTPYISAST